MHLTSLLGVIVACSALFIVVPFGVLRATRLREASEAAVGVQLRDVVAAQGETLKAVLALQATLQHASASLNAARATLDQAEREFDEAERAERARLDALTKEIAAYETEMKAELATLGREAEAELKDLTSQLDIRKNNFLVKWHGDDGVKTSKRMAREEEAIDFFNQVGEFAKKLLMFDGSRWVVLREYGGAQWLALMHDDGDVQNGDGKPTKPPAKQNSESAG